MAIEGYNTIIALGTTTATWTSGIYGMTRSGRERKPLDVTLLTDATHNYLFSNVAEQGMLVCKIRFDPKNEPIFETIETITLYYPPNGTAATYTALTNRPSEAASGGVIKVDMDEIKIEQPIDATVTIKYSGARTVVTGAA